MDIECPYCNYEQEANHDDGGGYEEGVLHQMQCESCEKNFTFQTKILFVYTSQKADCLNGGEHDYKQSFTIPRVFTKMECENCGEERDPTEEEWNKILEQK